MENPMIFTKTCYGKSTKIWKVQHEFLHSEVEMLKIAKCRGIKHLDEITTKKEWIKNIETTRRILDHKCLQEILKDSPGEPLELAVHKIWKIQHEFLNSEVEMLKIAKCRGIKHLDEITTKKEWIKNIETARRILDHKCLQEIIKDKDNLESL